MDRMEAREIYVKWMIVLLIGGTVPLVLFAIVLLYSAELALEKQVYNQLISVRDIKKNAIRDYFEQVKNQTQHLAETPLTIQAMKEFNQSFLALGSGRWQNAAQQAQKLYIQDNPYLPEEAFHWQNATDGSAYSQAHDTYHLFFQSFVEKFGYYDLLLVHPHTGYVVYSFKKEADYATSLLNPTTESTHLHRVWKTKAEEDSLLKPSFVDFSAYAPSQEAPAAFLTQPIVNNRQLLGVLIVQIPLKKINQIMSERGGMGKTGESYLVGEDFLMRSNSHLDPVQRSVKASLMDPENSRVYTEASQAALRGRSGVQIISDYLNNWVISAYTPLQIYGVNWALLVEINRDEAFQIILLLKRIIGILSLVTAAGFLIFLVFYQKYMNHLRVNRVMKRVFFLR